MEHDVSESFLCACEYEMLTLRMLSDPCVVEDVGDATPRVHEIPSLISAVLNWNDLQRSV